MLGNRARPAAVPALGSFAGEADFAIQPLNQVGAGAFVTRPVVVLNGITKAEAKREVWSQAPSLRWWRAR